MIPAHPDKDIQAALRHAVAWGWRIQTSRGHAWGRLYCPYEDPRCREGDFCIVSIWSTPRSPFNHARALRRVVDQCRGCRGTVAH
ncbi:hypothetical protein ACILG0_01245 [Pseudomonadota bacterium AL_CKDN230030165-1A_HGKHYDSX7]